MGTVEEWKQAENALSVVLQQKGIPFDRKVGEAAFYGPKIDIKILDSSERLWQCSTIQFDFNLPERFKLRYMGADGEEHIPMRAR
jgi:threonyl-tRNA synthetase